MKILFICIGNSFRSPVAEALYNKMMTMHASTIASNAKKLLEKENVSKRMPSKNVLGIRS